jgi:hypothetical protein
MANELQRFKCELVEEEIFEVSLGTFYVFDKENAPSRQRLRAGPCIIKPLPEDLNR